MQKRFLSVIKILLPLLFGIFLIYHDLSKLSIVEKQQMLQSILSANYYWVALSLFVALLSHIVRAFRWNYLTQPLGFQFSFMNSLFAVIIGYFANLAIPRLGELLRCTIVAKYEKKEFSQIFGTIIVERLFDLLIMMLLMFLVIITQFDLLQGFLEDAFAAYSRKSNGSTNYLPWIAIGLLFMGMILVWFLRKSKHPWIIKIADWIINLWLGVQSIFKMKEKGWFLFHTLLIWFFYLLAMYLCFLSFDQVHIKPSVVLTCFVVGGLSMALTQGGLGLYPLAIMQAMVFYGIDEQIGRSLGWLMWTTHTAFIIFIGIISLIFLPLYNKKYIPNT